MSLTKVLDNFYLGSYNDIIKEYYKTINPDVVINVASECKNYTENVLYFHYPFYDIPTEDLYGKFLEVTNLIDHYRKSNKNVFIHCSAGKSRSVTFVIAYLIKYMNYSFNQSYDYLFAIREIYINMGFINQLVKFEKEITGKSTLDFDKVAINYIHDSTGFKSKDEIKLIYYECNKDIDLIMKRLFT